jgi:hypothetical protein
MNLHTQTNHYINLSPRVQIYVYNKLPDVIPVKSWMLTPAYPLVLRWHHSSSASFAYFFPLFSLSSSCQHTQYVHCHDIRNRTTEYPHTHTPLEMSAFAKPPTYTLNPNNETSELAHFENKWRSPNRLLYASVGTASNQHGLEASAECYTSGNVLKNDKLHYFYLH